MSESKAAASTAAAPAVPPQAGAIPKFDLVSLLSSSPKSTKHLVNAKGDTFPINTALKDKVVVFYYSASWCAPCRNFTPKFAALYKELTQVRKKAFEVVFISSDHNADQFNGYMKEEMPWLAVPYADRPTEMALKEQFDVEGIPHVTIFNTDGTVISNNGKLYIESQGADGFPWIPPRVRTLDIATDVINEKPCLLVLMDSIAPAADTKSGDTKSSGGSGGSGSSGSGGGASVSDSVRDAVIRELQTIGADKANNDFGLIYATAKTNRWRAFTGIKHTPCVMITNFAASVAAGSKALPKYVDDSSSPFGVGSATAFLARYRASKTGGGSGPALKEWVKSADRPAGDADPSHPGMTIVTNSSFKEIVLDEKTFVFLDVYADWCGPCKQFAPHLHRVARAIKELGVRDIVIASLNNEENDIDTSYLPETTIPNLKLFPRGVKTPQTQIKYDAKKTDAALIEWLAAKITPAVCTSIGFDAAALTERVAKWNAEAAAIVAAKAAAAEAAFAKCISDKVCTFKFTGETYRQQKFWGCKTCNKPGLGACESCKTTCHAGHELTDEDSGLFYCDCGSGGFASCGTVCKAMPK